MGKKKQKKQYKMIAAKAFNQFHFLEPKYAARAFGFLANRMDLGDIVMSPDIEPVDRDASDRWRNETHENMGWLMRDDGTAVLPVNGSLYHGSSFSLNSSMGVGYDTIAANAKAALAAKPDRLALMVDSNGGTVEGCFACATKLRDMFDAADIPVWAFSNESMYSAAYALGSKADRIILPETAGVASVGVVSAHVNYEQQLDDMGIEVTMLTSGDKKVVGSPYKALSDEDFAELNSRIMKYAGHFFDHVAEQRNMSAEQVAEAQANIFIGSDAVSGDFDFADEVMDVDDFYYAFSQENANTTQTFTGDTMNKKDLDALQAKANKADKLQDDIDTLVEANENLTSENKELKGKLEDKETAASAAHQRYVTVMESDEAKGRQGAAKDLLADSMFANFSADQLCKQLEKMAIEDADETELGADAQALLQAAREKDSDTKDITNSGEDTDTGATGVAPIVKDEKGRIKSESYAHDIKTPADKKAALMRSAQIVKANRKRKHI